MQEEEGEEQLGTQNTKLKRIVTCLYSATLHSSVAKKVRRAGLEELPKESERRHNGLKCNAGMLA